jgi:hypothetical protein
MGHLAKSIDEAGNAQFGFRCCLHPAFIRAGVIPFGRRPGEMISSLSEYRELDGCSRKQVVAMY